MGYDENGQWHDEPGGPPEPGGIGGPIVDFFKGLFGPGGQSQPDQTPPPPPPPDTSSSNSGSSAADQAALDQYNRKQAADIAETEARATILRQQAADLADPDLRAAKLAEAKAAAAKAQADAERIRGALSPQAQAQFENDLAVARQRAQQQFEADQADKNRQFNADQTAAKNQFDSSENAAQRAFTGEQNDLSRGVSLRGQEIERLKAQDDWVLGILRQQVAEGTLSLQRATGMFNAYVDRARLPSQIMESVSRAIQPFSARVHGKDEISPGFEKDGPYQQLVRAGGGTPTGDEGKYHDQPIDLFKLAKKAGADFKHTSIPDPGKVFGAVPIPQTDFSQYQSALAGMPPAFPGGAGGAPPPPSAAGPPGAGPAASATPAPDWQMSDDQIAQLNALLDQQQ